MQKLSRPLGVSIIANFSIILGIIGFLAVVAVSVGGVNTANTEQIVVLIQQLVVAQ